jgi:hypothetical protein
VNLDEFKQIAAEMDKAAMTPAEIYLSGYVDGLTAIWNVLLGHIEAYSKSGKHLPGDGTDKMAERNGMILAANLVSDRIREKL